jgi:hypothetical protein
MRCAQKQADLIPTSDKWQDKRIDMGLKMLSAHKGKGKIVVICTWPLWAPSLAAAAAMLISVHGVGLLGGRCQTASGRCSRHSKAGNMGETAQI